MLLDTTQQLHECWDIAWVGAAAVAHAFLSIVAVNAAVILLHSRNEFIGRGGEIQLPGKTRLRVVNPNQAMAAYSAFGNWCAKRLYAGKHNTLATGQSHQ